MNELTTKQEKTREDVEHLKENWSADSCFDIEDVPGFEAYHDELVAFSKQKKVEWAQKQSARIINMVETASFAIAGVKAYNDDATEGVRALNEMVGNLIMINMPHVIAALKAYQGA